MWEKAKDFLQRAFTLIFVATIIVWFLQSFSFNMHMVSDSSESILAMIAGVVAPIFAPAGLGDWRIVTAIISGFLAKESIVSLMTVLYGGAAGVETALTSVQAAAFMVFCLLYTPCVAAVASIGREQGKKYMVRIVLFQCVIAWAAACVVNLVGSLIM